MVNLVPKQLYRVVIITIDSSGLAPLASWLEPSVVQLPSHVMSWQCTLL